MTAAQKAGAEATITTLEIDRLNVQIPVRGSLATVIHDVTIAIGRGETVGLVGESGSGKSMTARAVMRMLMPRARVGGEIRFEGRDIYGLDRTKLRAYRARSVAMIYQSPHAHINPVRTIGDFLTEALVHRGDTSRREAEERVVALLEDVGIPDGARRLKQYPHQLSGGLLQRVMIASALAVEPRLLLADEPTTALDVTTQEEVMAILGEVRDARALSMLLITHDLDLASAVTDRIAVMYAGMIVESATSSSLTERPLHPYTVGLLEARPTLSSRRALRTIPGRPASGFEVGSGCVFAARCPFAQRACVESRPALREVDQNLVACHRAEELRGAITFPGTELA